MSNLASSTEYQDVPPPRFDVFASGLDHPECVAIDRHGHIWAGGEAGQIYRIDPAGAVTTVTTLGGFVAGIAFSPLDHALFVCNTKLGLFRVAADGRHALFATEA